MNRIISAVLILLFVSFSASACKWHRTEKVSGRIEYFGNAPFEFPVFIADDGRSFTLDVEKKSKFTVKDIEALYGKKIQLKGYIFSVDDSGVVASPSDEQFVVKSFKEMKEKRK